MEIHTNNIPRDTIDWFELTPKERREFDYYTAEELDSATFFRYKGNTYDLGEFMRCPNIVEFANYDGYTNDTYFSGILVRYTEDGRIIVATFYSG